MKWWEENFRDEPTGTMQIETTLSFANKTEREIGMFKTQLEIALVGAGFQNYEIKANLWYHAIKNMTTMSVATSSMFKTKNLAEFLAKKYSNISVRSHPDWGKEIRIYTEIQGIDTILGRVDSQPLN